MPPALERRRQTPPSPPPPPPDALPLSGPRAAAPLAEDRRGRPPPVEPPAQLPARGWAAGPPRRRCRCWPTPSPHPA